MAIVNKDELARGVAARSGLEVGQAKSAVDAALWRSPSRSPMATRFG